MTIEPEKGEKQLVTPVLLGTANVDVGNQTFLANQYVVYTTEAEQFKNTGRWRAKATATISSSDIRATDYILFRVMP
jgi:hypothetical protein